MTRTPTATLPATPTTETSASLILDSFESGTTSKWSTYAENGATVSFAVTTQGYASSYAGRATYAIKNGWGGVQQAYETNLDWSAYSTMRFWFNGEGKGNSIRVEVLDNRATGSTTDTAERWVYGFTDNTVGWRQIAIPWSAFTRRIDWQPPGVPNDGFGHTQVWGFNVSPMSGSGTWSIDKVELIP